MFELPPVQTLKELSGDKQAEVLDNLFEPCPTLTRVLIERLFQKLHEFSTYKELIETARAELLEYLSDAEKTQPIRPEISQIIAAHPRLGATKKLSDHSSNEQKSLEGSEEEARKLADLNSQYEDTFPGLRYVVFVNGRSRETVMQNMKQRIARGDIVKERVEAFNAMCDIALDRARKLLKL